MIMYSTFWIQTITCSALLLYPILIYISIPIFIAGRRRKRLFLFKFRLEVSCTGRTCFSWRNSQSLYIFIRLSKTYLLINCFRNRLIKLSIYITSTKCRCYYPTADSITYFDKLYAIEWSISYGCISSSWCWNIGSGWSIVSIDIENRK